MTKRKLKNVMEIEASPVTDLTINSAMTFSNVLVNYSNIGIGTQAGAINCLVVSRTDSNLVLAGAQNGGVWISHNAARSWKPVNDTARSLGLHPLLKISSGRTNSITAPG
ncbi:MAG: hypothetical protein IPP15_00275 [Saprospiraceae bacterium]|uniref:Uncharacterized protein n=1 Tax=Candidatus Opimibacter skivensis TaxID=2982028 RepID=A0A9D7SRW5_9BACT|nr:hypothetical protein [Candidatus Opimibacter skivensis]